MTYFFIFIISQPDSGEKALDIVEQLIKSGIMSLIVVDSVAALTPEAELKGEIGDSFYGFTC
nr:DNA recombination/repair protein RecA [Texas Phoenix palm phytoplasma]